MFQTLQSPLQDGWNDNNPSYPLGEYSTGAGATTVYHLAPYTNATGGCYISQQATSAVGNVYYNNKGTISISLVKSGSSSGTLTTTPFQDANTILTAGTAIFTLTITDSYTGQKFTSVRSITYGAI